MSFADKKVTPLQEYKDDGVIIDEKKKEEVPESPSGIQVAAERKKVYSFKDLPKMFKELKGE